MLYSQVYNCQLGWFIYIIAAWNQPNLVAYLPYSASVNCKLNLANDSSETFIMKQFI